MRAISTDCRVVECVKPYSKLVGHAMRIKNGSFGKMVYESPKESHDLALRLPVR